MINKDDIINKHLRSPEPKEVTKMRKHILNTFKNLEFIEEGHKYFIHNEDGTVDEPISASGVVKEFEPFIDWDQKAINKAKREGVDVSVIKRLWEENNVRATTAGSITHLYGENLMKFIINPDTKFDKVIAPQFQKGYLIPCSPKQEAIEKYWVDIMNVDEIYPLIPEVKMYMPKDNKFGIKKLYCGTADITFAMKHKGEWCILVHDYKTNASLTNEFARNTNQLMLEPFSDFIDESMSHYTIQLNLYSLMLNNLGYNVIDRRLIWLKPDGEYEKVQLPDISDRIIKFYS